MKYNSVGNQTWTGSCILYCNWGDSKPAVFDGKATEAEKSHHHSRENYIWLPLRIVIQVDKEFIPQSPRIIIKIGHRNFFPTKNTVTTFELLLCVVALEKKHTHTHIPNSF